jgi:hypothetical protein
MTYSDMKTKKFPCIYQSSKDTYHSICGRYRIAASQLAPPYHYLTLSGDLIDVHTDLGEAHCYIERRHPELRSGLCQLLMTDN